MTGWNRWKVKDSVGQDGTGWNRMEGEGQGGRGRERKSSSRSRGMKISRRWR